MTCPSLEEWAAWVLGEHEPDVEENLEEHLFSCDVCASKAEKLQTLVGRLRTALPPVLTAKRRRVLEQSVSPLPVVHLSPGESASIALSHTAQNGLWLMRANLTDVERVDVRMFTEDGALLVAFRDVPFDAERGEVVLACQAHYRHLGWPTQNVVRVTAVHDSGERELGEYHLNHLFLEL